ncbi:heme o synthase [Malassezia japonica]|uniref:Heme o synthase n=1 Tax=Malassezia japonica TaxID=223818 RepID=A0AAF0EZE1_9BASI|nr:heme o synthase [Malassezia japonica]WFD39933.1 heme o synthase [Malassezia japonica]
MLRRATTAALRVHARGAVRVPLRPLATSSGRLAENKPKDPAKDARATSKNSPSKAPKAHVDPSAPKAPVDPSAPKVDVSETARKARAAMAKQMRAADEWPHTADDGADPAQPLVSPTAEDLLKQRFLHAQKRAPGTSLMMGGSGTPKDVPSFFREDKENKSEDTSLMGSPSAPAPKEDAAEAPEPPKDEPPKEAPSDVLPKEMPVFQSVAMEPPPHHPRYNKYEQPFNTHVFVRRLEEGEWRSKHGASPPPPPTQDGVENGEPRRRHDPAEAIMDLTRALLQERGEQLAMDHLDRSDLDNQLYLFSSALSELRTEVRVRARNDAAALRSLTSLLQREVDGLSQKLQAEIERLKHDIQVDMNHRKTEVKDDNNNLELEIQDLNNRFTIFLSDLKTEIEQSIKWDATRRALALVFGIVAILVCTLALADYFSRPEVIEATKAKKKGASDAKAKSAQRSLPVEHGEADMEAPPPKSAEEWGLLPRYDSEEARYV